MATPELKNVPGGALQSISLAFPVPVVSSPAPQPEHAPSDQALLYLCSGQDTQVPEDRYAPGAHLQSVEAVRLITPLVVLAPEQEVQDPWVPQPTRYVFTGHELHEDPSTW